MGKTLFFIVSLLALTGTYCFPAYIPFGDPWSPLEEPEFEMPDGPMLVEKYNKTGCLKVETDGPCPMDVTFIVYHHNFRNCVLFVYGGCINNQRRMYTAKLCNGKCLLPPDNGTATTKGEFSTSSPTTVTSNTANASSNPMTSAGNTATQSSYTATTSAVPATQTSTIS